MLASLSVGVVFVTLLQPAENRATSVSVSADVTAKVYNLVSYETEEDLWIPFLRDNASDYFAHKEDRRAAKRLDQVERHHFDSEKGFHGEFRRGNYAGCVDDLRFILSFFPNHPRALTLLGMVSTLWQKPKLPLAYYAQAIRLFPQHAVTHAQYGRYLVIIGSAEEGLDALSRAVELDPDLAIAHAYLAEAYYKMNELELGDKELKKARILGWKGMIVGAKPGE